MKAYTCFTLVFEFQKFQGLVTLNTENKMCICHSKVLFYVAYSMFSALINDYIVA